MTDYQLIKINLSEGQLAKARSALKNDKPLTIRIGAHNLGHTNTHLSLTQRQLESMEKKHKAGLGSQLTVSHAALKHAHTHGAGFGDMLKSGAKQIAAWGIRKGGNALADYVGSGIKKPAAVRKVRGKGFLTNMLGSAVKGIGNLAGNAIQGCGVKKIAVKRAPKKVKGHGFLTSLLGGAVKGLGNLAGDAIQGCGVKKKRIGKKRSVKLGNGFLAPGY